MTGCWCAAQRKTKHEIIIWYLRKGDTCGKKINSHKNVRNILLQDMVYFECKLIVNKLSALIS